MRNQGFSEVTARANGDHYDIKTDEDSAEPIKQVLEVYLKQR
ncbi:hypothetical protein [Thermaerobacillus caldiproteolyticus]|uniref:Uncharacterized protein n=1 Tax=Thermaerobacillus caldiproteolyticus TaxID=247480 RepID=A0A7V9Z5H5_9BACL|nr:hypothetical protein [Anoxybacillus caldiproteolyticus]MBA2874417.1 hypothetical protein [Anoxybacillus caldiproteolyticus]